MPEPREVTAIAILGSTPIRYRIPFGVLVPWEPLIFKTDFDKSVPITVSEGSFMIEARKTGTSSKPMTRLIMRTGGLTGYMLEMPVSLPDSFHRALPKLENQYLSILASYALGFSS